MDPVIKAKWVSALRSGEYQQTQGKLKRVKADEYPVGFCCLGVLCDLHAKEKGQDWKDTEHDTRWHNYFGISDDLPIQVQEWAGLSSENPEVRFYDENNEITRHEALAVLNDDYRYNFTELADLIEEQL